MCPRPESIRNASAPPPLVPGALLAVDEVREPLRQAGENLLFLRCRQPSGGDGRVNAVLARLLQRGGEGARLDAELLRGVVDDGLAVAGRPELRRSNRAAGASGGERRGDSGDDLAPDRANHASPPSS